MNGRVLEKSTVFLAATLVASVGLAVAQAPAPSPTGSALSDHEIIEAARRGDAAAVGSLLDRGADVDAAQGDGMTALHWAAERGHAEIAEVLLSASADVEAKTRIGFTLSPSMVASYGAKIQPLELKS